MFHLELIFVKCLRLRFILFFAIVLTLFTEKTILSPLNFFCQKLNDLICRGLFLDSILLLYLSTRSPIKLDFKQSKTTIYYAHISQIILAITVKMFNYLFIISCCHLKVLIDFCFKCKESKLFTACKNGCNSALDIIWHGLVNVKMLGRQK